MAAPPPELPHASSATRAPGRVNGLIVVGFSVVLAVTLARHEMWRDELQAWTLTNSSTSLRDLLHNLRYEGHPALWYWLLFPITRATDSPEAMQLLQFVVAVSTVAIAVRYAPFTALQKAALAFGYFVVFEYGALSRSYGLGVLLTFTLCAVASRPHRRWWLIGALLALLALTSAFGAMLAIALGAGLVADELVRRHAGRVDAVSTQSLAAGATIALSGVLVSYAQSIPPGDAGEFRGWRTEFDPGEIGSTLAAVWRAFVPVPQLQREFWNTNVLDGRVTVGAIAGVAIVALVVFVFRTKPATVVMWGLGLGMTLVFLYAKIAYAGSGRHYGHIFVLFIAMQWLAPALTSTTEASTDEAETKPAERRAALLTVVLGLQLVAGTFAIASDWTTPFSDGKAVAQYLRREGYDNSVIIGHPDTSASTVAGYLRRDVYFPQSGRFGEYIIWDTRRVGPATPLAELLPQFAASDGPRVLVLRTAPLAVPPDGVHLIAVFDDGIVADEHYWLYLADRPKSITGSGEGGASDEIGAERGEDGEVEQAGG